MSAPSPANPSHPPRRVLVVDDNVDSANSMALLLRLDGHDVRVAHDGPEALAAAAAFRPGVIILDIGLPGMSGLQVAREIRRAPEHAGVVIIAMTGYGEPEDRARSRAAGIDHHLTKPIDEQELAKLLHRLGA